MNRYLLIGVLCGALGCTQDGLAPDCEDGEVPLRVEGAWSCTPLPTSEVNALAQAELACAEGQVAAFVDGQWRCSTVTAQSGGDITGVATAAGSGLTGGADQGSLSLAVAFEGSGTASTVARSDHRHGFFDLLDVPGGFLDRVDNDALGALACAQGDYPRWDASRAAWSCAVLPAPQTFVETDPSVNSLGKATLFCSEGQVAMRTSVGWGCTTVQDRDTLASLSCPDGQTLAWSASLQRWSCSQFPADLQGITSVAAGSGLTAQTDGGSVQLAVNFQTACASGQVACADQLQAPVVPPLSQVLGQGNDAQLRRIANVAAPVAAGDVATKGYVDALGGSGSSMSVVLCCGATCAGRLPGWNCDDVASSGKVVIPIPDQRGMIEVPNSGQPRVLAGLPPTMLADGGVVGGDVLLNSCSGEWQVCTQTGFANVMLTCGEFTSSSDPTPWTCTAPPQSYIMVPGTRGMIYVDGTDAANEYLKDNGQSASPASVIDCSGAPVLPGPQVSTGVCFR
ncbi:MAG: hypothetical protein M3Y59_00935 [Myxococcota bacterium]|nr:hypothetical protein [Myxococcota bacterium]